MCFLEIGGHINPAVTFGLLLARKLSLTRAIFYMVMQCLGAICGAGVVKGFELFLEIYVLAQKYTCNGCMHVHIDVVHV